MTGFPMTLLIEATTMRKIAIHHETGEVFAEGDHYEGYTLTIALTEAEAITCARALFSGGGPLAQGSAIDETLAIDAGVETDPVTTTN